MPLRNPFKRSGPSEVSISSSTGDRSFSNAPVAGAQPIEDQVPVEYQLSEIDDSGVFLPPSPALTKPRFWHSKSTSSISSNHRSLRSSDTEPFNMSRESFDSYRRSFDISASSPVASLHEADARRSLDSSRLLPLLSPAHPRCSRTVPSERLSADLPEDEELEDVGLADEDAAAKPPAMLPRRRGLFALFTETNERAALETEQRERDDGVRPSYPFQLFSGRKRGQSGQGDELRSMNSTATPAISVGRD